MGRRDTIGDRDDGPGREPESPFRNQAGPRVLTTHEIVHRRKMLAFLDANRADRGGRPLDANRADRSGRPLYANRADRGGRPVGPRPELQFPGVAESRGADTTADPRSESTIARG
jgi:hypothetical protein